MKKTVMVINRRRDSGIHTSQGDAQWIANLHRLWRVPPSRRQPQHDGPPTVRRSA